MENVKKCSFECYFETYPCLMFIITKIAILKKKYQQYETKHVILLILNYRHINKKNIK